MDTGIADIASSVLIKAKAKESVAQLIKRITGIDIELCKHCKTGRLEKIESRDVFFPGAVLSQLITQ